MLNPLNLGAVLVAIIAALGAWASQRAAARASRYNADASVMSAKAAAELEAYNRARNMDIETIKRQDEELEEIRLNNKEIRTKLREVLQDNERLHEENATLRRRVSRLEEQLGETSGNASGQQSV